MTSQPYEIAKNGEKTGGFAHILAYKSPKTPFFAPKYLTTYIHKTFFEEYTNFEANFFSRFGVIFVRSFGSHIRPQPHGLGLRANVQRVPSNPYNVELCSMYEFVFGLCVLKNFIKPLRTEIWAAKTGLHSSEVSSEGIYKHSAGESWANDISRPRT
jgi:hypothetical protein